MLFKTVKITVFGSMMYKVQMCP